MLIEKTTGTIRTAYDPNGDPYLFEATGTEAKRVIDILNAEEDGRLLVLPSPLPEGHGRLIDADALLNSNGVGTQIAGWGKMFHETTIAYAPTIVPADVTDIDVGNKKEGGTEDGN